MALLTYANHQMGKKIKGKILKSKVDFDSFEELNKEIKKFNPDVIGVSTMTFHKNFFHKAIKNIRENGFKKTIIVGGPHPTTSYTEVLKDQNIDICVLGEGEATLVDILEKIYDNNKNKLLYEDLISINGIAFSQQKFLKKIQSNRITSLQNQAEVNRI